MKALIKYYLHESPSQKLETYLAQEAQVKWLMYHHLKTHKGNE